MSLLDWLLDRLKGTPALSEAMTFDVASQIVREYGAVLEVSSTSLGGVADVRELPYPKERIKAALIVALRATTDKKVTEQLKGGYVFLADWQPGVGAEPISYGFGGMAPGASTEDMALEVAAQTDRMTKWAPVIAAESEALKAELQQLGLW